MTCCTLRVPLSSSQSNEQTPINRSSSSQRVFVWNCERKNGLESKEGCISGGANWGFIATIVVVAVVTVTMLGFIFGDRTAQGMTHTQVQVLIGEGIIGVIAVVVFVGSSILDCCLADECRVEEEPLNLLPEND
jgi:hypothetical protein